MLDFIFNMGKKLEDPSIPLEDLEQGLRVVAHLICEYNAQTLGELYNRLEQAIQSHPTRDVRERAAKLLATKSETRPRAVHNHGNSGLGISRSQFRPKR